MNEEEFLKEHPSLKGLIMTLPLTTTSPIGQGAGTCDWITIKNIHETQVDKQKIDEVFGAPFPDGIDEGIEELFDYWIVDKLMKLGIRK